MKDPVEQYKSDIAAIYNGLNRSNERCYNGESSDYVEVDCDGIKINVSWSSCQSANIYQKIVDLRRKVTELEEKLNQRKKQNEHTNRN